MEDMTTNSTQAAAELAERLSKQERPDLGDDVEVNEEGLIVEEYDDSESFLSIPDLTLEKERGSHLMGAFAVKHDIPEGGIWIPLDDADGRPFDELFMLINRSNNDEFVELMSKAARKYGNKKGQIDHLTLRWILPSIYAKTLWRGLRGPWRLSKEGEPIVRELPGVPVFARSSTTKRVTRRITNIPFNVDPETGLLIDSDDTRLKLMQAFPDIQEQVWAKAEDDKLFPVGDKAVLGNS